MRLSTVLLIPVVVAMLVVMLVPYPSYADARKINVNVAMRLTPMWTPEIKLSSNYTLPSYWYHVNAFWTTNVRQNSAPQNYSWKLEIVKEKAGHVEWRAYYYWPYSIVGAYWINQTYSFEGQRGDTYQFVVYLHYNLPFSGEGDVAGIYASQTLRVVT